MGDSDGFRTIREMNNNEEKISPDPADNALGSAKSVPGRTLPTRRLPGENTDSNTKNFPFEETPPQYAPRPELDESQSGSTLLTPPSLLDLNASETLSAELFQHRIISNDDWREAVKVVGGETNLTAIIVQLTKMPASWDAGGDETYPALTPYQMQCILTGKVRQLRLHHYLLLKPIGAGGMGQVFTARNLNLPRIEAIKTIISATGDSVVETMGMERFEQEAKLLARLNHRYLTTIHHAGVDEKVAFIAMEYVQGKTLKEVVEEAQDDGDKVPVWWAAKHMSAVAEALQYAHANNVIHRDIKPSNVMILPHGDVRVLDLGIARFGSSNPAEAAKRGEPLTKAACGLGTPEVMPPEQWADAHSVTPASDVYSLGCTFYYVLTGQMPFGGDTLHDIMFAHIENPPPRPSKIRQDAPAELDDIFAKMMAKLPKNRYQNMAEVIEALKPFVQEKGKTVRRPKVLRWTLRASFVVAIVVATFFLRPWVDSLVNNTDQSSSLTSDDINKKSTTGVSAATGSKDGKEKSSAPADGKERIRDIEQWLGAFQKNNPDEWENDKATWVFANTLLPRARWSEPNSRDTLAPALEKETWKRRVQRWLALYQKNHKLAWPNPQALQDHVHRQFPTGVETKEVLARLQTSVEVKTRNQLKLVVDDWLIKFQADPKVAKVWSDLEELRAAVSQEELIDDQSFVLFTKSIETLTRDLQHPFEGLRFEVFDNPAVQYRARLMVFAYERLLLLAGNNATVEQPLESILWVDNAKVAAVPVGKEVELRVRTQRAGFVTLLNFGHHSDQILIQKMTTIPADKDTTFFGPVLIEEPGIDKLIFLVTEYQLLAGFPNPPTGVESPVEDGTLFLQLEGDEVKLLAKVFKHELIYRRVLRHLQKNLPYPFAKPPTIGAGWSGRREFELRSVKP